MVIKNFWSLEVGEAFIADLIREKLGKKYQVFFPLNNQLKDFDLILVNTETKQFKTIQVKESREFLKYSYNGWFIINKDKVDNEVADFYIFVIYGTIEHKNKVVINPKVLIVPSEKLKEKSQNKKPINEKSGLKYHYGFNIQDNRAFDDRTGKQNPTDYSEYIDNFNLLKI